VEAECARKLHILPDNTLCAVRRRV